MTQPRIPPLNPASFSADQRRIYDEILAGPRGVVQGPLRVWLSNAGLAERAQALGAYCRYGTCLKPRLSELAIVIMGAHWRAGFEWAVHAPIARAAGVPDDALEALRVGATPQLADADQRAVYEFATELLHTKRVSAPVYAALVAQVGIAGAVDLVGIMGYYSLISMTITAFEVPVPDGEAEPFAD